MVAALDQGYGSSCKTRPSPRNSRSFSGRPEGGGITSRPAFGVPETMTWLNAMWTGTRR
jgi:hypothetical protein